MEMTRIAQQGFTTRGALGSRFFTAASSRQRRSTPPDQQLLLEEQGARVRRHVEGGRLRGRARRGLRHRRGDVERGREPGTARPASCGRRRWARPTAKPRSPRCASSAGPGRSCRDPCRQRGRRSAGGELRQPRETLADRPQLAGERGGGAAPLAQPGGRSGCARAPKSARRARRPSTPAAAARRNTKPAAELRRS